MAMVVGVMKQGDEYMIELTAAFVVEWMLRPLWEYFLKPILKVAIEAKLKEITHESKN